VCSVAEPSLRWAREASVSDTTAAHYLNSCLQATGVFLVQAIVIYTVGIKLYTHISAAGGNNAVGGLVCFVVCVPLVAIAGEVFYRLVDLPSVVVARGFWAWMTK
jgi:hypothetical protein